MKNKNLIRFGQHRHYYPVTEDGRPIDGHCLQYSYEVITVQTENENPEIFEQTRKEITICINGMIPLELGNVSNSQQEFYDVLSKFLIKDCIRYIYDQFHFGQLKENEKIDFPYTGSEIQALNTIEISKIMGFEFELKPISS